MNIPAPFNQKQLNYLANTFDCWLNVAEGGKRGSKNVLNTYAFCLNLETHPDKIHLIAGVTNSTARINIAVCDGFGIFNYFEGRYREGKFQDRQCIYVQTKVGEKVILVAGGRKKGDEAFIKGFTLGSSYITEANECHKDFLKEVSDRTLSSSNRKIFHDLNPKDPHHYYYDEILGFHEKQQKLDDSYGYNYGHFTIADNMSISNTKLRNILNTYEKGTVWYDRDIKGLRRVAEGLVFPYYPNNEEQYLVNDDELIDKRGKPLRYDHIIVGVDFGDSGSKYSFHATGYTNDWYTLTVLTERDIEKSNGIDTDRLCNEFIMFYREVIKNYGYPEFAFCDSASNTLINTLISACRKAKLNADIITGVVKNEVSDRPRTIDLLLRSGRLKINRKCKNLRKAMQSLVWDEKDSTRPEDENIDNINDYYDSFCYTFITHTEYIERM